MNESMNESMNENKTTIRLKWWLGVSWKEKNWLTGVKNLLRSLGEFLNVGQAVIAVVLNYVVYF